MKMKMDRRIQMTMKVDMPQRKENAYTNLIGEMMEVFSKSEDPQKDFSEFLESLGMASGFLIGSILEREARSELLQAYLQSIADCTTECNKLHLMANSDIGIRAD
jgi:Ca2+-binding EF-hand superfamily protein